MSHHVRAGKKTGPLQGQTVLLTAEPCLSPYLLWLFVLVELQ